MDQRLNTLASPIAHTETPSGYARDEAILVVQRQLKLCAWRMTKLFFLKSRSYALSA